MVEIDKKESEFIINKCKWCGNDRLIFKLRPDTPHYGEMRCSHCNRFCYWAKDPENEGRRRNKKETVEKVCKFHNMKENICFLCLRREEQLGKNENLTIDHIIELNKSGEDIIQNMQVLCSACHKLKNWLRLYCNWHNDTNS